jgi:hypothetical protein
MPAKQLSALLAYVRAWSAPDLAAARELLAECWTEESEIVGPGYYFKGFSAVLNEIDRFQTSQPGWTAIATSGFDTHGLWTRFTIAILNAQGTCTNEGWDIIEQDVEGKIRRVITFWGPLSSISVHP